MSQSKPAEPHQPRIVEVRANILKKNDELARAMRGRFSERGVYVVNVVSGPGAGKTALLSALAPELTRELRVAALTGDLATDNDAERLVAAGVPSKQILTGTLCHLEAVMVESALESFDLDQIDLLFIENIGNLVCPQGWDLGEDLRVLLFPSTEGEDKPLKYPTLINTCDLVVLSKMDIADAVEFDREVARRNCDKARPGVPIVETSAKTGLGISELAELLAARVAAKKAALQREQSA